MVDLVGITERQSESHGCVYGCISKACQKGSSYQQEANSLRHDDRVKQGVPNRCVAVVCHHGQEEAFSPQERAKEVELGSTSTERNGFVLSHKVDQHLRSDGGGVRGINKGEAAEKEVHGRVQTGIELNQHDQPQIAQHGRQVNGQEQHKEKTLEIRIVCES